MLPQTPSCVGDIHADGRKVVEVTTADTSTTVARTTRWKMLPWVVYGAFLALPAFFTIALISNGFKDIASEATFAQPMRMTLLATFVLLVALLTLALLFLGT
jgi:hypothetical protein